MLKILALGDSLTAGYGLAPEYSFASRLEKALKNEGRKVEVINAGISGDTTHDGLMRIKGLLRHRPDLVIIQFGANDLYAGLSAEQVRTNLMRMIDMSRSQGAAVLVAGILCLISPDDPLSTSLHRAFKQAASSCQVPLLEDFMPEIPGNPDLTLPDGIHPNERGVDKMVKNTLPLLLPILDGLMSRSSPGSEG